MLDQIERLAERWFDVSSLAKANSDLVSSVACSAGFILPPPKP